MNILRSGTLLLLLLSAWTARGQVSFTRTDITTGYNSQVAIADFNGDGVPDIAVIVSATEGSSVLVYLGNGDGTFQTPKTTSFPAAAPKVFAVADFNLDGKLDIVANDSANNVGHVLLGNGDGTFKAAILLPYAFDGVAAGDFNGDGIPDLAMALPQNVDIALGKGDGTFETPVAYPVTLNQTGVFPGVDRVALADFNNDGRLDVVAIETARNEISILLGNGDGTFRSPVNYAGTPNATSMTSVAIGDLNGDGVPDIVVGSDMGIGVFLGNGDGTFQAIRSTTLRADTSGVAIGDFNSDGIQDVVALNYFDGSVAAVLPGLGNGTFGTPVDIAVGNSPAGVAAADLNGDLVPDIVTANLGDGSISILINNDPGAIRVSPSSGGGSAQTFAFTFSDRNGPSGLVSTQIDISATLASSGACYFYYQPASNSIYLADDQGAFHTPLTIGASGNAQNSQCMINAGASSVATSGKLLTLSLALTFEAAFSGAKNVYMEAFNGTEDTGWVRRGTWNVGSNLAQDFSFGISPNSQTVVAGASATYTVTASSLNGFDGVVNFGISGLPSGATGSFNPPSVTGSGSSTLTIQTSGSTPIATTTIAASGSSGALNHQANASLDVMQSAPPSPISVIPSGQFGNSAQLAFTFSDPNGGTDIVSAQIDVSAQLSATGACYLYYSRAANTIYLANDAGAWQGPLTIGSSGMLQNSQCSVFAQSSSVSISGNTLILSLDLGFQTPAFDGQKSVFMEVRNATQDSGWINKGSFLVQASVGPAPSLSFSVTPSSRSVAAGGSTTFGISITSINGFSGVVTFNVSGLPGGATASFNPTTVTASGSTTLTISTSGNVAGGTFFPTISAVSGTINIHTSVSLNITQTTNTGPDSISVTPNSGSGSAQIFTFAFSDPSGATDIVSAQMDINAQLSSTNACYFYYSRASNALYLANNAGAWQGPVTLGTAGGGLSNSQCSVDPEESSVSASGNTLTLSLAISFQAAFAGAKGIFMEVQNATQDSGWSKLGSWTATAGSAPSPDFSLGMNPGSDSIAPGASANYTVTVTALNGFSGVVSFGASGLPSGATASFNPTTVNGSGSTTLTVNTSSSGDTGSFTIGVTGTSGALSHNTSASLGIISGSVNAPPEPVSVTSNSSSGSSQTFAFNFSDPNGATDIVSAQMDINAQLSSTNACYFYYSRTSNALYLANDAGAWQGPATIGSSGTLSNSQCSVNVGGSSVSASGTTLTLNLAISFQAAFAGTKGIFMEVQSATQDSGWSNLGSWTVTSGGGGNGGSSGPPAAVSVTPNSSSGSSQTFAFTFTDPNGATDIVSTQMEINAQLSATNACYFYYSRASNALYLANDAGAWQGPVTVGGSGTLSNSQCSVNAGGSSASASGTTLTLNLAISFEAGFAGAKNIYMEVQNATVDSGWSLHGAWTVP
jgi:hypothetical protein